MTFRLEAIAKAIAIRLLHVASWLEAIASRLEAIATAFISTFGQFLAWRGPHVTSLVGQTNKACVFVTRQSAAVSRTS